MVVSTPLFTQSQTLINAHCSFLISEAGIVKSEWILSKKFWILKIKELKLGFKPRPS
jgi:hypothetical protein